MWSVIFAALRGALLRPRPPRGAWRAAGRAQGAARREPRCAAARASRRPTAAASAKQSTGSSTRPLARRPERVREPSICCSRSPCPPCPGAQPPCAIRRCRRWEAVVEAGRRSSISRRRTQSCPRPRSGRPRCPAAGSMSGWWTATACGWTTTARGGEARCAASTPARRPPRTAAPGRWCRTSWCSASLRWSTASSRRPAGPGVSSCPRPPRACATRLKSRTPRRSGAARTSSAWLSGAPPCASRLRWSTPRAAWGRTRRRRRTPGCRINA